MGKGLLGPNSGSGRKFEGRFGEHCGGNGGIGGSISGVGEGIDESIGGMGGGSLARHVMVSNDGRGGGVENNSSIRSRLIASGDVSLDGCVGAGGGKVNGGGVVLGVSKRLLLLLVGDRCGVEVWEVGVVGGEPDT
ncbi:hypothetical protein Tco_0449272 [Tanacetum coccineum]